MNNLGYFLVAWISDKKEFVALDTFTVTYTWQTALLQIDVSLSLVKWETYLGMNHCYLKEMLNNLETSFVLFLTCLTD